MRFVITTTLSVFILMSQAFAFKYTKIEKYLLHKMTPLVEQNYVDHVTNAHEWTHQIHADIRRKHCQKNENGFLVPSLGQKILKEPPISKSSIAFSIPGALKGDHFNHYVVDSKDWENKPTYLIDEWIAYINGAKAGLELRRQDSNYSRKLSSGLIELQSYSNILVKAVQNNSSTFFYSKEGKKLKEIVRHLNKISNPLIQKILNDKKISSLKDIRHHQNFTQWLQKKARY